MTEEVYIERWKRSIKTEWKEYIDNKDMNDDEINAFVDERFHDRQRRGKINWEYSQIIAWIVVYYRKECSEITIETHGEIFRRGRRKPFSYKRTSLPHIPVIHHNCNKFNISLDKNNTFFYKTNKVIRTKIKSRIRDGIAVCAKKPLYANTALFDSTIDYIDILGVIENQLKEEAPIE